MSERQQVTAIRVANVPAEEFERQVESDNPTIVFTCIAVHPPDWTNFAHNV